MEEQATYLIKALQAVRCAMGIEEGTGAEDSVKAIGEAEDKILEAINVVLHCGRVYPPKDS